MLLQTRLKIALIGLIFLIIPFVIQAAEVEFNIDPSYDSLGRSTTTAFLHQLGNNAYFYVEDDYYKNLDIEKRKEFTEALRNLAQEFDKTIYPKLREIFGSEWKPGIDGDEKITVLLTKIKPESGGYFNSGDEYPKAQVLDSNEREIIYLNVNFFDTGENSLIKSYLAHEFLHLITFNQKERLRGVTEETWLNEGRAEVAPTILGYDLDYQGSNLQKRVRTFFQNPQDSLTEWKNLSPDYGVLNLFFQYLIDHYGVSILKESLQSEKIGILSLNEALKKTGFPQDFAQIFTDWTIAVSVNDCQLGPKYCYLNLNLKNLKILPQLNYLPLAGESTLTVTDYAKDWAGNWLKFIGGRGTLKIDFIGSSKAKFQVPYLLQDSTGKYSISFLTLNGSQQGTIFVSNFGKKYDSLILIPSVQKKISGFGNLESYHQFIWSASIISEGSGTESEGLIQDLLSQIESLKQEIAKVQAQIQAILAKRGEGQTCSQFANNLYYGLSNNQEVRCLQEFLKSQGSDIYPEGLVTGNFLTLTQKAVIRFQEKYAAEILAPLGLEKGTGFVGLATRAKINELLKRK